MNQNKQDRCSECGRFFNWTGVHIYTPFGSYYEDEPPDDRIICNNCWDKLTPDRIALIEKIAWQKSWK